MPIRKDYASCAAPKKTESAGHAALLAALGGLPPGRARVALALVAGRDAPTYPEVAARLGLGLGTVHTHLRRLRGRHPDVYAACGGAGVRRGAQSAVAPQASTPAILRAVWALAGGVTGRFSVVMDSAFSGGMG